MVNSVSLDYKPNLCSRMLQLFKRLAADEHCINHPNGLIKMWIMEPARNLDIKTCSSCDHLLFIRKKLVYIKLDWYHGKNNDTHLIKSTRNLFLLLYFFSTKKMDESNLVEISNVIYNHTWLQIHKRKDRIKQFLSAKINKEPIQKILKQSGLEYQQEYYSHLLEIEKSYGKYVDSLNHMAHIIPTSSPNNIIAAYNRVISSWQLLFCINDQCRLNIRALPDVADEEHRMEGALRSSQQAFGTQLKAYIWFTLCLCIIVLTGVGSNFTRLLVVVIGSVYFMIRGVLFVSDTTRILTRETEDLKLWLQLKQEIDNIHHDLLGFTELVHDTIECVKSM